MVAPSVELPAFMRIALAVRMGTGRWPQRSGATDGSVVGPAEPDVELNVTLDRCEPRPIPAKVCPRHYPEVRWRG